MRVQSRISVIVHLRTLISTIGVVWAYLCQEAMARHAYGASISDT